MWLSCKLIKRTRSATTKVHKGLCCCSAPRWWGENMTTGMGMSHHFARAVMTFGWAAPTLFRDSMQTTVRRSGAPTMEHHHCLNHMASASV